MLFILVYDNCYKGNLCGTEASFQARPSKKIFAVNIEGWLHYNKTFSFKMKESIVALDMSMKSLMILTISSTISS